LGRLKRLSGPGVRRILEGHGFRLVRQRGSHFVMQRNDGETTLTVPVPDHRELKPGVLRAIIRQTGIARATFEDED
jgi:predicted RNA binding protein YcfA (HicA-like mRNA interferase family)